MKKIEAKNMLQHEYHVINLAICSVESAEPRKEVMGWIMCSVMDKIVFHAIQKSSFISQGNCAEWQIKDCFLYLCQLVHKLANVAASIPTRLL